MARLYLGAVMERTTACLVRVDKFGKHGQSVRTQN